MANPGERPTAIPRLQLAALCGYSLVIWSLGNGILPLLPKVASSLHADVTATGLYLASSYAAIALGTAEAGWLADRVVHRKRLMIAVGLAGPPFVVATSAVTEFWQLILLTAVVWWLGGTALALANILGGLAAGRTQRGVVLGVLAMMAPAGSILGGLGVGAVADGLGYSRMWILVGLLWLLCPAAGLCLRDVATTDEARPAQAPASRGIQSRPFVLLLACGVLGAVGAFIGSLGRSLVMKDTFTAEALTSTVAASGFVTLLFPLALGWMSDRFGRLRFIGLCYAAGVAGLVVYSAASSLADFWLASSLLAFVAYVAPGVASALVVDLVPRATVGRALALFGATGWIGGILGFASGGYLFQRVGYPAGFLLGAAITVVGILLLLPIGLARRAGRNAADRTLSAPPEARKG